MAATTPPAEFFLFSYLPTELRLMIWGAAARHRRTVVLRAPPQDRTSRIQRAIASQLWKARNKRQEGPPPSWYRPARRLGWTTPTPPPGMLHASRESRDVALRAYRLAFGWARLPPAVWLNFDADDVLVTRSDCLCDGGGGDRGLRARQRLEKAWLTTADAGAIQRVIACDMDLDDFKAFLGTPKQAPWRHVYPGRAQDYMLKGLESCTSVHVQQVWRAIRTLQSDSESSFKDKLKRQVVGLLQPRKRAEEKRAAELARHVFVSHDSGACCITEAPMVGHGQLPVGGAEPGSLTRAPENKSSKVLVEAFCFNDDIRERENWNGVAAQWTTYTAGGVRIQGSSDKKSMVVMAQGAPPSCSRLFCLVRYGHDLEIVAGSRK